MLLKRCSYVLFVIDGAIIQMLDETKADNRELLLQYILKVFS